MKTRTAAIEKTTISAALLSALAIVLAVTLLGSAAHAQTFSIIHTFTGTGGDGGQPQAGVTLMGSALFGTTQVGGNSGAGTVYQMTPSGSGWSYTPVFLFPANGSGGKFPNARVVFGPDGHLYGTTLSGGISENGVVFYLTPPLSVCKTASCGWKENLVWSFHGGDGANPGYGDLVWDDQGTIYGTTINGGAYNYGVWYQLSGLKDHWSMQVGSFDGTDYHGCSASYPWNGVTRIGASIFGTASTGPFGSWVWGSAGCLGVPGPLYAGVTADASGNLYSASADGGANGGGIVFVLRAPDYSYSELYDFAGTPGQQCGPRANLTLDSAGNLYGTTLCHGVNHFGNVFKLTKTGDTWAYTSLHDFTGGNDGAYPISNVSIGSDGTLYGTTSSRGANSLGTVWMIKP